MSETPYWRDYDNEQRRQETYEIIKAADALYFAIEEDHAQGETFSLPVSVQGNKYRESRGIPPLTK